MKIAFFIQGENIPASRYRVEQFIPHFKKMGINCAVIPPFFDVSNQFRMYGRNIYIVPKILRFFLKKITVINIILNYITRIFQLVYALWADVIFLQRQYIPFIRFFNKKIIYDYDDAIFLNDPKISEIFSKCTHIIAGNKYLYNYALKFNKNVTIIPTVIDDQIYIPSSAKKRDIMILGWMGTSYNLIFLKKLIPIFEKLHKQYENIRLVICADRLDNFDEYNKVIPTKFIVWNARDELKNLQNFDIGLMPLQNNRITRGKCGFKLILYMATGSIAVGSNVGVNNDIIKNKINGLLSSNEQDWYNQIEYLILNPMIIPEIRKNARISIEQNYSIRSQLGKYRTLFSNINKGEPYFSVK